MKKASMAVLGYDIGGTKVAVCVADANGRVLAHDRVPSGATRPYEEVMPEMIATGKRVIKEAGLGLKSVRACGICAPGPLDIANGRMRKSPNMAWDNVPVRDDLAASLGLPVFLDNDANAGVLAEWFFGIAKGCRHCIYLTMSTGIGGGVVAEGKLVQGTTGIAAELGHAILDLNGPMCGCGMRGCLEAFCGGRNVALRMQAELKHRPDHAIMRLPEVKGDLEKLGYPALRAAVKAEIPYAVELWDEICLRLAQGVGLYLMTFNPEMIVLGTIAYYSGDMMMKPIMDYLPRFAWKEMREPCQIVITALGDKIGELAGASVALNGLYEKGEWQPPKK